MSATYEQFLAGQSPRDFALDHRSGTVAYQQKSRQPSVVLMAAGYLAFALTSPQSAHKPLLDVGISTGLLKVSQKHTLYDHDDRFVAAGHRPLQAPTPTIGAFTSFSPFRHMLIGASGRLGFARDDNSRKALLWSTQATVGARLPLYEPPTNRGISLSFCAGGGAWGVASSRIVVGNDVDAYFSIGTGFQAYIDRIVVRLVFEDRIANSIDQSATHSLLLSLGLGFRILPKHSTDEDISVFD